MQQTQDAKTIGILGGMGPAATALAFELIIAFTPAKKDNDHLPCIIYNLPQIPDRTEAILHHGPSPVPAVISVLKVLQKAAVDFVIIPCNTVFYYYREFSRQVDLPILHTGMPVIKHLQSASLATPKIGILSTIGTRKTGIYDDLLQKFGYEPVLPSDRAQEKVMRAIYQIKAGDQNFTQPILQAGLELLDKGASQVILGCTELSLVYDALREKLPVVDTTRLLALAAIDVALAKKPVNEFIL